MNGQRQDQQELRDLYQELILDHARSPRHFGKLADATHSAQGINPLCGDKLHLYFNVGADDTIGSAAFEGSGCAISVASASLMTDAVLGMPKQNAVAFGNVVIESLTQESSIDGEQLGKLVALQGVREFPSRVKCATLAWHALMSAINRDNKPVSTE